MFTFHKVSESVCIDDGSDPFYPALKKPRVCNREREEERDTMSLQEVSVAKGGSPDVLPMRGRESRWPDSQVLMPPPSVPGPLRMSRVPRMEGRTTRSSARRMVNEIRSTPPETSTSAVRRSTRKNDAKK